MTNPVSLPFTYFMFWRLYALHFLIPLWRCGPTWVMVSTCLKFLAHTQTHHSPYDSSGRVISSSQRPLPDNIQHSQEKDKHALGGIRTHNLSRRKDVDLRLRPRGHWKRLCITLSRAYFDVGTYNIKCSDFLCRVCYW